MERLTHKDKLGININKLPCPIGTEVYKVREVCYCDFNYDDEVCTRYCKYKCEEGLYCEHQITKYEISKVLFTIDMCDEFNKTIFLTKEEVAEEIVKRKKKNKYKNKEEK